MNHATKAACLSAFLFPGCGHFYLKLYLRAAILICIAGIGLLLIMSAAFDVAWTIAEKIQFGEVAFDIATIRETVQQAMAVFDEPEQKNAKYAIIGSWLISTIDAYREGKIRDSQIKKGS